MADIFTAAAVLTLIVTATGLFRILWFQKGLERMMAVQLLGTGGASATLLFGAASGSMGMVDVALLLVLLSVFSCAAFALGEPGGAEAEPSDAEKRP